MKKSFAAIVLTLGLTGLAHAASMPKGDASAGQAKSGTCVACHGADGNSFAPTFPRIAGQNAKYIYKQLQDFKANRRYEATMSPMVIGLSDQDMADLAAFYSSQKTAVGQADPKLVEQGERLFRGGNPSTGLAPCSGCHNPGGKGNDYAGFPALAGQHADYIKKQLRDFRAAGRKDMTEQKRTNDSAKKDEAGMMQMIAAKMSDQEIEAVASFLSGLYN